MTNIEYAETYASHASMLEIIAKANGLDLRTK
jgi:hypothetical protein